MPWQLQEAKQHFSKVVRDAEKKGPQVVTRHGEEVAVVISMEEYRRLRKAKPDFKEFLLSGPKTDDLVIPRSKDYGRELDLGL